MLIAFSRNCNGDARKSRKKLTALPFDRFFCAPRQTELSTLIFKKPFKIMQEKRLEQRY